MLTNIIKHICLTMILTVNVLFDITFEGNILRGPDLLNRAN